MPKFIKLTFFSVLMLLAVVNSTNAAFPKEKQISTEISIKELTSTAPVVENSMTKAELKKELKSFKKQNRSGGKSKIVAALLAFFLGSFGVHSFYMGNKKKGLIQLGLGVAGVALTVIGLAGAVTATTTGTISIPALAIVGYILLLGVGIWAFVDFIRILTGGLEPEEGFDS